MTAAVTAHLWQSTLFAIAAALLTLAFRRNQAKVRFWLWFSASVKFFVPFALLMSLGNYAVPAPNADRAATPEVSFVAEQLADPFFGPTPILPTPRTTNWAPRALFSLWFCGVLIVLFLRARAWFKIRSILDESTVIETSLDVELRSSPSLLEPGVAGWLHPVLLLPECVRGNLTDAQLEAVLAHELCHVRRRDNLFAAVHMAVEALYWFHPMVWWIGSRLVEERERACDESVLILGNEPRVYADAILNVCKLYVESPTACVSGVSGANIKRRIEAIMAGSTGEQLSLAKTALLAVAGAIALASPVAVGLIVGTGALPIIHAQPHFVTPTVVIPLIAQDPPPKPESAPVPSAARRMIALFFDFAGMTHDQQADAHANAVDFVANKLSAGDQVAVIAANNGRASVLQDFTADRALVNSAIPNPGAETPSAGVRLVNLEGAIKLLSAIHGKKQVVWYRLPGKDDPADVANAIEAAKRANIAIYPVNPGGLQPPAFAAQPAPLVADSTNFPQPLAVYSGTAGVAMPLFSGRTAQTTEGLPGRRAEFQMFPRGETLYIPLESMSGEVTILAQITRNTLLRAGGPVVASLADKAQASAGSYQANFILHPGAYTCRLLVREPASSKTYGETIDFELK